MVEKVYKKTYSYTARLESVAADAAYFFHNPIFGANLADVMYAVPNNTCTSPIIFAVFGIVGGCVHVLSWVALAWKKERHWMMNLILMLILFIPFNTQNVIMDMFFWLFPIMAMFWIRIFDTIIKRAAGTPLPDTSAITSPRCVSSIRKKS